MAQKQNQRPYLKIVLIGDQGVGKTALLDSFEYKKISKTQKPTIGADFMKKKITLDDNGLEVNLQLWDTAGQERFQSLCTSFYRGADCCIIVYDVSNERSYE
jgi:Ras-related protein Rab-7A